MICTESEFQAIAFCLVMIGITIATVIFALGCVATAIINKHYFCKEADHNYDYCLGRYLDGEPHRKCRKCKKFCLEERK